jgi:23S rRNA (cytosine1962-C5)-methyltransferase
VWKLEDDLFAFCKLCAGVLSEHPRFVLINSYTAGVSAVALTYIADTVFGERFSGVKPESRELALLVSSTGLLLPAGVSCRVAPYDAKLKMPNCKL